MNHAEEIYQMILAAWARRILNTVDRVIAWVSAPDCYRRDWTSPREAEQFQAAHAPTAFLPPLLLFFRPTLNKLWLFPCQANLHVMSFLSCTRELDLPKVNTRTLMKTAIPPKYQFISHYRKGPSRPGPICDLTSHLLYENLRSITCLIQF